MYVYVCVCSVLAEDVKRRSCGSKGMRTKKPLVTHLTLTCDRVRPSSFWSTVDSACTGVFKKWEVPCHIKWNETHRFPEDAGDYRDCTTWLPPFRNGISAPAAPAFCRPTACSIRFTGGSRNATNQCVSQAKIFGVHILGHIDVVSCQSKQN